MNDRNGRLSVSAVRVVYVRPQPALATPQG